MIVFVYDNDKIASVCFFFVLRHLYAAARYIILYVNTNRLVRFAGVLELFVNTTAAVIDAEIILNRITPTAQQWRYGKTILFFPFVRTRAQQQYIMYSYASRIVYIIIVIIIIIVQRTRSNTFPEQNARIGTH